MNKNNYKTIIDKQAVDERIKTMAGDIVKRYKDQSPLFVCLLRGGAPFASLLMFAIAKHDPDFHPELDYMTISTYATEKVSRQPKVVMDLAPNTKPGGRHVVILDDVLDEGGTAAFVKDHLLKNGAKKVDLIVLVQKRKDRTDFAKADMFGFESPPDWLAGLGMDDPAVAKEAYRWLGEIRLIQP